MVHGVRSLGSAALDMVYVATGAVDIFWEGGCWEWVSFERFNQFESPILMRYRCRMYALVRSSSTKQEEWSFLHNLQHRFSQTLLHQFLQQISVLDYISQFGQRVTRRMGRRVEMHKSGWCEKYGGGSRNWITLDRNRHESSKLSYSHIQNSIVSTNLRMREAGTVGSLKEAFHFDNSRNLL